MVEAGGVERLMMILEMSYEGSAMKEVTSYFLTWYCGDGNQYFSLDGKGEKLLKRGRDMEGRENEAVKGMIETKEKSFFWGQD